MLEYSVALCTYNGARYIAEQLNSIICQSVPPSQIVVSDDGSTDGTIIIVNKLLSDCGIEYKFLSNNSEHGVTPNFQNAISNCTYPIVFTSDQDDVWMKNKAEVMLHFFDNQPKVMLCFSDGELVDSDLQIYGCSLWKSVGLSNKMLKQQDWFHYLLKSCLVTGAAMAFRKDFYESVGSIPKEWIHDGWLSWAAVARSGLCPCPSKLFLYRQHTDNVVGMAHNSKGHIKRWLSNFEGVIITRENRYKRFMYLKKSMGIFFSDIQNRELDRCIFFWKSLCEMENKCFFKNLLMMIKFFIYGYYHKYYVGTRGFFRDLFLLF